MDPQSAGNSFSFFVGLGGGGRFVDIGALWI